MPKIHLDGHKRYCGASTQCTGQSKFTVGGKLASVEGDKDDHNNAGDLIQRCDSGKFTIGGKKAIVAQGDTAASDSQGGIQHPFAPTDPREGYQKFSIYGGNAGGGLGSMLSGKLQIGELVKVGTQLMGLVKNFTAGGGSSGQVVLQNMPQGFTPQAGDTLVGQDSGATFQLTDFTRDNSYDDANTAPDYTDVLNIAVTDDFGVIAVDEHFTGKSSQDYNTDYIVVDAS